MDISLLALPFKGLLHDTIGLITIFNPLAAAAVMVSSSSSDLSAAEARVIGKKAAITVLIGSLLTIFLGNLVFKFFGISIASVMVIGGIVLLVMALSMVQGHISLTRHSPEESDAAKDKEDISVIPIAIPVILGPGAISTLMVFHVAASGFLGMLQLLGAVLIAVSIVYVVLINADYLTKALGVHGMKIMTRIMGLIVGAIAVQFVIRGTKTLWETL